MYGGRRGAGSVTVAGEGAGSVRGWRGREKNGVRGAHGESGVQGAADHLY